MPARTPSLRNPWELRRNVAEIGEPVWQVVGYYPARPAEADEPGYSVVDRTTELKKAAAKAAQGA